MQEYVDAMQGAYNNFVFRHFKLHLLRDMFIFHPDAVVETSMDGEVHHSNISHLYHGSLLGIKLKVLDSFFVSAFCIYS